MADDDLEPAGDGEERVPRPPIVIPKQSRLLIGAVVVIIGLVLLVVGAALVKVLGALLVVGGAVDLVVGRRQPV